MGQGDDAGAVVRKLLRRRSVWFVVGVVAVLVFAIFVAGTTWSLLTPGYVLEDGELAADFAVLFGSLSLAALSVFRARRLSCRADTLFEHADTEQWLPPREPRDGQGEIDLDAQVFRLRTLSLRAWRVAVLWCAVLVGGMVGLSAITSSADSLLATGTRTTGEVLTVLDSRKPSMVGALHRRGHVRDRRDLPELRPALQTGRKCDRGLRPDRSLWLRASSSTHGATVLKDEPNRPAWVGGTGRDMVVLFPQARWRKLPYAVPAFAKDQRRPCRARQRSTYRAAAAPPRPVGKRARGRRQPPS
jgi:hypothetical protein